MSAPPDGSLRIAGSFRRWSSGAGAFAITVGMSVLVGWALDIPALKSVAPNLVSMKANAALAFVLAGAALCLLQETPRPAFARRLAQAFAALVGVLGLLVLAETVFALDLGIDQLLVADPLGAVGTAFPGRVAPTAALDFTLVGAGLLLLDVETRGGGRPAQWLALAAGFVAILTFVGQVFAVDAFLGIGKPTQVAVHTMTAHLALCAGLLFARPGRGLMTVVTSDSSAGRVARRMLPATILLPVVLAGVSLVGQRAGLYGAGFAMTVFAASQIMLLGSLMWWNASGLLRADTAKREAELARGRLEAERAREAAALDRAHTDFRQVIDKAPDGIVIRRGRNILYANPAFAAYLGYPHPKPLVGVDILDLVYEAERKVVAERFRAIEVRGTSDAVEVQTLCLDGSVIALSYSQSQEIEFEGGPAHLVMVRDMTQRNKLQAQLLLSDRMASVGTLAAGVAHEINNPLAAVLANLQVASQLVAKLPQSSGAPSAPSELGELLTDSHEGAERVRQIVRDLNIFSRSQQDEISRVDAHEVLDSTLRMASNEIRHRARLVKDYGPIVPVAANEARLGQVFLNLLVNAAQAIPEGRADSNEIRVTTRMSGTGRVVIEVGDTGSGISPEAQRQLFTPFFTTKPIGMGTGLGLSICDRIVRALGGEIEVESRPGEGATFRVILRAAGPETAVSIRPPAEQNVNSTLRGCVLIIDDDAMVAKALSRIISSAHDVTIANRAVDAMERISTGERFDVILCDLMMPDVDGLEFHARLASVSPELAERVVFVTGGAFTANARKSLEELPNPRLEKPIDSARLHALIRDRVARQPV